MVWLISAEPFEIARLQRSLQDGVVPGVPSEDASELARRLDGVAAGEFTDVFGQFPEPTQRAVAEYLDGLDTSSVGADAVSLEEIWNGPKYVEMRRRLVEHGIFPVCRRCCKVELSPEPVAQPFPEGVTPKRAIPLTVVPSKS